MGKKVEVSYNPQLGYLQTVFKHDFDFLTGVRSYTPRDDGAELVADTYKKNTVKVLIQYVGETAVRFRMFAPGSQGEIDNSVYEIPGQKIAKVTEISEREEGEHKDRRKQRHPHRRSHQQTELIGSSRKQLKSRR